MLVLYSNGFKCLNIQSELFYAKSFIKTFDRERIVENVRSDRQFNETSIVCMCVNSIVTKCKFPLLHFVFFFFCPSKNIHGNDLSCQKGTLRTFKQLGDTGNRKRERATKKTLSHTHRKYTNEMDKFIFSIQIYCVNNSEH